MALMHGADAWRLLQSGSDDDDGATPHERLPTEDDFLRLDDMEAFVRQGESAEASGDRGGLASAGAALDADTVLGGPQSDEDGTDEEDIDLFEYQSDGDGGDRDDGDEDEGDLDIEVRSPSACAAWAESGYSRAGPRSCAFCSVWLLRLMTGMSLGAYKHNIMRAAASPQP